jgi:hypothetical protein
MRQRSAARPPTFYEVYPIPVPAEGTAVPKELAKAFFLHLQTRNKRPGLDPVTVGEGLPQLISSWHTSGPARQAVQMESQGLSADDLQRLAQDPAQQAATMDLLFFQNMLAAVSSGLYYLTAELAPALATETRAHGLALHVWAAMFELHGMMQHRVRQRVRHALLGSPLDSLPACHWPLPYRQTAVVPASEPRANRPTQRGPRKRGAGGSQQPGFSSPGAGPTAGYGAGRGQRGGRGRGFRGRGQRHDDPSQVLGGDPSTQ